LFGPGARLREREERPYTVCIERRGVLDVCHSVCVSRRSVVGLLDRAGGSHRDRRGQISPVSVAPPPSEAAALLIGLVLSGGRSTHRLAGAARAERGLDPLIWPRVRDRSVVSVVVRC